MAEGAAPDYVLVIGRAGPRASGAPERAHQARRNTARQCDLPSVGSGSRSIVSAESVRRDAHQFLARQRPGRAGRRRAVVARARDHQQPSARPDELRDAPHRIRARRVGQRLQRVALVHQVERAVPLRRRREQVRRHELHLREARPRPGDRARRKIERGDAKTPRRDAGRIVAEPAADIERARACAGAAHRAEPRGEQRMRREIRPGDLRRIVAGGVVHRRRTRRGDRDRWRPHRPARRAARAPPAGARRTADRPASRSSGRFAFRGLGGALWLRRLGDALHRDEPAIAEAVDAGAVARQVGEGDGALATLIGADLDAVGVSDGAHHLALGHLQRDAARAAAHLGRQRARRAARGPALRARREVERLVAARVDRLGSLRRDFRARGDRFARRGARRRNRTHIARPDRRGPRRRQIPSRPGRACRNNCSPRLRSGSLPFSGLRSATLMSVMLEQPPSGSASTAISTSSRVFGSGTNSAPLQGVTGFTHIAPTRWRQQPFAFRAVNPGNPDSCASQPAETGRALKYDQVEAGRGFVADDGREQAMRLTAVMRLMIEEMVERGAKRLLDVARVGERAVAQREREVGLGAGIDPRADPRILGTARRAQRREIVVQDGVEPRGMLAAAGEAAHPDAVGEQQVIERAVHRLEERAAVGAIVGVGKPRGRVVEALIGPRIVGGEHRVA